MSHPATVAVPEYDKVLVYETSHDAMPFSSRDGFTVEEPDGSGEIVDGLAEAVEVFEESVTSAMFFDTGSSVVSLLPHQEYVGVIKTGLERETITGLRYYYQEATGEPAPMPVLFGCSWTDHAYHREDLAGINHLPERPVERFMIA